jgi:hypothetical protein
MLFVAARMILHIRHIRFHLHLSGVFITRLIGSTVPLLHRQLAWWLMARIILRGDSVKSMYLIMLSIAGQPVIVRELFGQKRMVIIGYMRSITNGIGQGYYAHHSAWAPEIPLIANLPSALLPWR